MEYATEDDSSAYQGTNTVCCRGRVIMGTDWGVYIGGIVYVLILLTLFAVAEFPFLLHKFSPIVVAIPVGIFLYGSAHFWRCSFMDPGIIPRPTREEASYFQKSLVYQDGIVEESRKVLINGIEVEIKWCKSCKMWRPPRGSHCSRCNNCIEMFDHHCAFMGNCIGKRNYRHFFLYLLSMTSLLVYALCFSVYHLFHHFIGEGNSLDWQSVLTCVNCVTLSVTALMVGVFFLQHCYLSSVGLTTREEVNGIWTEFSPKKQSENPFGTSSNCACAVNIFRSLCGAQYPKFLTLKRNREGSSEFWIDISNRSHKIKVSNEHRGGTLNGSYSLGLINLFQNSVHPSHETSNSL